MLVANAGCSSGSVTCTNRFHPPAPSSIAASWYIAGIDCRPAR